MMLRAVVLLLTIGTAVGCSSTREIETSPPRTREPVDEIATESQREARVTVVLHNGETELPEDVAQLRFRISGLLLHEEGGEWIRLPSDMPMTVIESDRRTLSRTIVDTRIRDTAYDSIGVSFEQVFVRFNENAGGPLAVADGAPQTFAFDFQPVASAPTTIRLNLEPEASVVRSPECRWIFVPLLRAEAGPQPSAPERSSR